METILLSDIYREARAISLDHWNRLPPEKIVELLFGGDASIELDQGTRIRILAKLAHYLETEQKFIDTIEGREEFPPIKLSSEELRVLKGGVFPKASGHTLSYVKKAVSGWRSVVGSLSKSPLGSSDLQKEMGNTYREVGGLWFRVKSDVEKFTIRNSWANRLLSESDGFR